MDGMSRARVSGPLGLYAGEFRDELLGWGYTPRSAAAHLGLMKRFGCVA